MKKYEVIKRFGKYKVGQIVNEDLYIRRKLQEGGCLKEIEKATYENKKADKKMEKTTYENKMFKNTNENQGE